MCTTRGRPGFETFSHRKVVGIQPPNFDLLAKYPPYKVSGFVFPVANEIKNKNERKRRSYTRNTKSKPRTRLYLDTPNSSRRLFSCMFEDICIPGRFLLHFFPFCFFSGGGVCVSDQR